MKSGLKALPLCQEAIYNPNWNTEQMTARKRKEKVIKAHIIYCFRMYQYIFDFITATLFKNVVFQMLIIASTYKIML